MQNVITSADYHNSTKSARNSYLPRKEESSSSAHGLVWEGFEATVEASAVNYSTERIVLRNISVKTEQLINDLCAAQHENHYIVLVFTQRVTLKKLI